MTGLAAIVLATPIFGLSLQPPDVAAFQLDAPPVLVAVVADAADAADVGDGAEDAAEDSARSEQEVYRAELKLRNGLAKLHKPLGLATWAAMTATVVLGTIQYYNLYGFYDDIGGNPCVRGEAIFGQGQCSGRPWPHLAAAGVTTGLYLTTGSLAAMMPDPDDLAEGPGEFSDNLRMHKLLRWVHVGGMLAQTVLGIVVANPSLVGMDRANDYDTLQHLATVHLATGYVTYGALSWAGYLMYF